MLLTTGFALVGSPPGHAAELSPCVDPDNGRPRIEDVTFSPAAVDATVAAQQVSLRMRVTDEGGPGPASGLEQVSASVGPDQPRDRGGSELELAEAEGGWWEGTFTVPVGATPGAWRVEGVSVQDRAGNLLVDPDDVGYDFLAPHDDRTVQVTTTPDTGPPTATSLTLSPRQIDTTHRARRVEVRVGAEDDLAGVRSVYVAAHRRDGASVSTLLTERDGDVLVGALRFPKKFGRGRWRIRVLTVTDAVGNTEQYFRRDIDSLGNREFRVVAPKDLRAPRVVWRTVRPSPIDIRRDEGGSGSGPGSGTPARASGGRASSSSAGTPT